MMAATEYVMDVEEPLAEHAFRHVELVVEVDIQNVPDVVVVDTLFKKAPKNIRATPVTEAEPAQVSSTVLLAMVKK